MLILTTLGAPERRRLLSRRRRKARPEPDPTPVTTGRATIVDVGHPLADDAEGRTWLGQAGEDQVSAGLVVLNHALQAHRLVSGDPYARTVSRAQALVARVGFGAGEEVAQGKWTDARELIRSTPRQRRIKALHPQARLAAVLGGRASQLACEELTLRARLDLDEGRTREAALQLVVALDGALSELAGDPALLERLDELRQRRDTTAAAGQAALAGPLGPEELAGVEFTLGRVEAALRARAAAGA